MQPEGATAPWDGRPSERSKCAGHGWPRVITMCRTRRRAGWSPDGWFRTGDVATIDEDGYIKLVDRSKEMIKSGGEWISSLDLENALMGHPAVKEACRRRRAASEMAGASAGRRGVERRGAAKRSPSCASFLPRNSRSWQLPDAFVFAEEIPRTSASENSGRRRFASSSLDWKWKC